MSPINEYNSDQEKLQTREVFPPEHTGSLYYTGFRSDWHLIEVEAVRKKQYVMRVMCDAVGSAVKDSSRPLKALPGKCES